MSYLIDTNVLSELRRRNADNNVVSWFAKRPASLLYISVLTLGEIRKGVNKLELCERRSAINDWLETDLPQFFAHRILPIDQTVAEHWGRMLASAGRPLPVVDSLLAATARAHNLCLVTRNTKDFHGLDVELLDPWGK